MDNMIISGIRIYFPKQGERLPTPEKGTRTFAVAVVGENQFNLYAFINSRWVVMAMPEFDSVGKAIMGAIRQGKALCHS